MNSACDSYQKDNREHLSETYREEWIWVITTEDTVDAPWKVRWDTMGNIC